MKITRRRFFLMSLAAGWAALLPRSSATSLQALCGFGVGDIVEMSGFGFGKVIRIETVIEDGIAVPLVVSEFQEYVVEVPFQKIEKADLRKIVPYFQVTAEHEIAYELGKFSPVPTDNFKIV